MRKVSKLCNRLVRVSACILQKIYRPSNLTTIPLNPNLFRLSLRGVRCGKKDRVLQDESERMRWLECIRQFIFSTPIGMALLTGLPSLMVVPVELSFLLIPISMVMDCQIWLIRPIEILMTVRADSFRLSRMAGEKDAGKKALAGSGSTGYRSYRRASCRHFGRHLFYSSTRLRSNWKKEVRGFNVLYAFGHRGLNSEAAAYHPTAHAISIPGKRGLGINRLSKIQKCKFVSSILHELGHALLFEIVTADELREKAIQLGRWNLPTLSDGDIWSTIFFGPTNGPQEEFVSEYAQTNVHEWFAESFAAYIWQKELLDSHSCQAFKAQHLSNQLKQWLDILLIRARQSRRKFRRRFRDSSAEPFLFLRILNMTTALEGLPSLLINLKSWRSKAPTSFLAKTASSSASEVLKTRQASVHSLPYYTSRYNSYFRCPFEVHP